MSYSTSLKNSLSLLPDDKKMFLVDSQQQKRRSPINLDSKVTVEEPTEDNVEDGMI